MRRPARKPPACRLVRPAKTIITSLLNAEATLAWPTRRPSPAATISVIDTIPHAMPNIVSSVRSLCAKRVRSVSRKRSLQTMVCLLEDDLVAFLHALDQLGLDAVRDPELHRHLALAPVGLRVGHLERRLALLVVQERGLRHRQDAFLLLEDHLGVRGHVRLELAAGIQDRDAHLEGGHVVLLDAERGDLGDLALERLLLEGLDHDARALADVDLADVRQRARIVV